MRTTSDATRRPPGRPRNRPPDEQRAAIIAAARHLFAQFDFAGTTIEAVAREARVTRPAVYEFFKNKEELFAAVADDCSRQLTEALREAYGDVEITTLRAFVHRSVAFLFEFIERYPDAATIIRLGDNQAGRARTEIGTARHHIEDDLVRVYEVGWEKFGGISHEAARVLALLTLAMVEAVGFRQASEEAWETGATIELLTDMIVGGQVKLMSHHDLLVTFGT